VRVDLQLIDPPHSVHALRRGDLDIAIIEEGGFEGDPDLSGLGVERLMDDLLYASLPADHPLATRRAIALGDLKDEEWMLVGLSGTCADSNVVLRACAQAGFEPRVAYTSDDYFAIQGLVASGMGVALVPGLALAFTRSDIAVRPLRGRPPYRRVGAVFAPDPIGPLAVMLDCLRDAADEYRRSAPMSAVAA
jgi:DNA-binding transcriptional LysR family regulator